MAGSAAVKAKKNSEKDLYASDQTNCHMPERPEPHTKRPKTVESKKGRGAIAKKRSDAIKKEGSMDISEDEVILVNRAIEAEMAEVDSGKQKTFTSEEIKKELGL
jgi:hypothetical protein